MTSRLVPGWLRLALTLAAVLAGLLAPSVIGDDAAHLGKLYFILSLLMVVVGLNIVMGFAGQLFLGPTALFSVGGYFAAYMASRHPGWQSLQVMCLCAVAAALVIAALSALPTARINGLYFGLLTLYIAQAVPQVATKLRAVGGQRGINLLIDPRFTQKPTGTALYDIGLVVVAAMAIFSWALLRSRLGRQFSALRNGDEMASAVGVRPAATKMAAFLLGAVPCGLGGAFYLYSQEFITPSTISPQRSVDLIAGLVIGGAGTILGPLVGASLVLGFQELLTGFAQYSGIAFGVLLIVVASIAPGGLASLFNRAVVSLAQRRRSSRSGDHTPARTGAGIGQGDEGWTWVRASARPLEVRGVSRSFGGVRAVDGVDLNALPGTVHALVGPNGSGKTTLLNIISGYVTADAGSVRLGDERLDRRSPARRTASGIGRTFQTPKLSTYDTALANVVLGADRGARSSIASSVLGLRSGRRDDRASLDAARRALELVGLSEYADLPAGSLSHGIQRLLEIARVIAMRPEVVLLDEPAAGLSAAETVVLIQTVKALAAAGLAVVIVEHNLPVVYGVADEVTVLDQGTVIAHGTPSEVANDPHVISVYLGRRETAARDRQLEGAKP